jgi:hypothetical protein
MTMSPAEARSATVAIPESGQAGSALTLLVFLPVAQRQLRTEPGGSGGALESTGG